MTVLRPLYAASSGGVGRFNGPSKVTSGRSCLAVRRSITTTMPVAIAATFRQSG